MFGGYNPRGGSDTAVLDAISAFLFTYPGSDTDFVKLGKTGGSGMAIIDEDGKGPKWGPDGLAIDLEARGARARLGTYYAKMPDGGKSLFGTNGGSAVALRSLRVYVALEDSELAKRYEPNISVEKRRAREHPRGRPGNEEARVGSGDAGASSDASSSGGGFKFPWQ